MSKKKTIRSLEIGLSIDLFDSENGMLVGQLNKHQKIGFVSPDWMANAKMNFPEFSLVEHSYDLIGKFTVGSPEGSHVGRITIYDNNNGHVCFSIATDEYGTLKEAFIVVEKKHIKSVFQKILKGIDE
jgi:hypothetical protein